MQLGMIGLGRMGANMVRRLEKGGPRVRRVRHRHRRRGRSSSREGMTGTTSRRRLRAAPGRAPPRVDHGAGGVRRLDDRLAGAAAGARRHDHRRRQLVVPRRRRPGQAAGRRPRHRLRRRRHERRHPRPRARLLPDGRRSAPTPSNASRRSSTRWRPASGRAERTPEYLRLRRPTVHGRAGLAALRPERRRALREDGPQRHRVRPDGRVRRRAQRAGQGRHRLASTTPPTPRRHRSPIPSTTSTTSTWRRSPRCGAGGRSWPAGCST